MAAASLVGNVDAFIESIEKSGLLSAADLAKVREIAAAASDPKAVARPLVKDGTLTKWQATQLLYGYHQLVVGKFKLLDQISADEMGRVYLAEHAQMGRRHCLKVLSRRHVAKPDVLKRFLAEAQQVCALEHRNLSHIYDVNQDGDRYYVVMEHVEGQDLERLVQKSGKLAIAQAVDYARQAAEGLAHAHEHNVVHGDLRPANLVLDASGTLKILDIGQALLAEGPAGPIDKDDTAETGSLAVTIHRAPEQRGAVRTIDQRSDVYSLGSVLCYLLTGNAALDAATARKQLQGVSQLPDELSQLCVRMMAEAPEDRPASMQVVLEDLAKAGRDKAPPQKQKFPGALAAAVGPNGKEKSTEAAPAKAKKPPVAKRLADSGSLPVAKAIEEPAPAAGEEEPAGFGGFAIQTKGRRGAQKPPVKTAAPTATAAAVADEITEGEPASAKRSYLPLIIGGAIGGGVLAIAGIGLIVFVVFFSGGEPEQIADASKGAAKGGAVSEASSTEVGAEESEANPESNPAEEANPIAEANPLAASTPTAATPAAATAGPAKPAAEQPKLEATKPADPPTAAPMPEAKPAEPPKAAPMPAPKVEPPAPKPAPKPAPPANPFAGFAKAVTLPALPAGMSEPAPEALVAKVLGPCKVEEKTLVIAHLKGGEFAVKGGRQKFEMQAAKGGTALQDWEITLPGESAPIVVAKLSGTGGNLTFQWTPEGAKQPNAPYLANCALELSAGAGHHVFAFREPVAGAPLVVEVEKASGVKWVVDNLPDPKSIHFEITKLEGIPRQRYEPENVIHGSGEDMTIWTGPADDTMVLGLKLSSRISGKNMEVATSPQIKFDGDKKTGRFSKKEISLRKTQLTQILNGLTFQLNQLGTRRDERTEQQRSLINQELEKWNKTGSQIDALAAFVEAIQGTAQVQFRVYYMADDVQVDLVTTSAEAAPPAEAKS